jgi:hypothetical protein
MANSADSGMRVYYGPITDPTSVDEFVLSPAPLFTINTDPIYVGENIIGSIERITLTGYLTSINQAKEEAGTDGLPYIMERIRELKSLFGHNGYTLLVKQGGQDLIKAVGSKVVSFNIERTENNWVNYATYTVELEFGSISYLGCGGEELGCEDFVFGLDVNAPYNNGLINVSDYRIRNFSDSWSFELGEEIYQNIGDTNTPYSLSNQYFTLTYTLDAEGYHYYNANGRLIPAWEQAKNFCQYRLYQQLNEGLIGAGVEPGILVLRTEDKDGTCNPDDEAKIDKLFEVDSTKFSLLGDLERDTEYKPFNETIDTTVSESNGTFSLSYTVLIKRITPNTVWEKNSKVLHTITRSKNVANDNKEETTSISIDGNIQGLVEGGLILNPQVVQLQQQGQLLIVPDNDGIGKYQAAKEALDEIYSVDPTDSNNIDFERNFKERILEATYEALGVDQESGFTGLPSGPKIQTMNISHDFSGGSISYQASFDSKDVTYEQIYFTEFTITQQDPIEVVAEIVVPGKADGTVVQKMNTTTPRTISIAMNGFMPPDYSGNFDYYSNKVCSSGNFIPHMDEMFPDRILADDPNNINDDTQVAFLTADSESLNPLDGSFTATRTYTYYDQKR